MKLLYWYGGLLVLVLAVVAFVPPPEGGDGHGLPTDTLAAENREYFVPNFGHMVPQKVPGFLGEELGIYYHNLFQWVALVLILAIFVPVRRSFAARQVPWLIRIFRGWVLWIRDEMIYPVLGQNDGRQFAPYFIFLFFFILFMNVVGLIPNIPGIYAGATPTGDFWVTGALAMITLVMMIGFGSYRQGAVAFWVNLLPRDLPLWLIPLMIVVELTGIIVKPFALTVRLFANMLAGHLVIYAFLGLIFVFAKLLDCGALAWATAVPSAGLMVFMYTLEAFITILQAYIFTYLSVIFVQQAMHPAH